MPHRLAALLRRLESRALLALLAGAGAVWAFLAVGGEVREGEPLTIDEQILLALRTPGNPEEPLGSRSIQEAMRDITALGGFTVLTLVTVVAAIAFLLHRKARHALVLVATVLTAQLGSDLLKQFYARPRPDLAPHGVYVYSASFPSGHSMLSATVYLTLAMLIASLEPRRATKALVFATAVLVMTAVGISRIYLAVHWPSDVLAGWCAGAVCALIAWTALWRLERGRVPDRDD
ncbi:phosphatase PAP2 family protein [Phenylobacterium sp. LjRoot219]|uniref:phosphatase PAP2 family protein n=1 Tax=Phenylobacterium sp. LjRoot219 TaxID=3342283 RepID=UPI003ECC45E1